MGGFHSLPKRKKIKQNVRMDTNNWAKIKEYRGSPIGNVTIRYHLWAPSISKVAGAISVTPTAKSITETIIRRFWKVGAVIGVFQSMIRQLRKKTIATIYVRLLLTLLWH